MRIKFLTTILFSITYFFTYPQDYKFDHITSNDGLGDDFVRRVFKDSYGFIWIATKDGLSQYDGYKTITYRSDQEKKHSLPSSYIADIKEDKNGNIWFGTGNGLSLFDREYENFTNYYLNGNQNTKIFELEWDSVFLWIATQDGICKFNTETKESNWFFTKDSDHTLDKNYLRAARIQKDKFHNLWIGFGSENGLVKLNTQTGQYKQYSNKNGGVFPGNAISGMSLINDSTLLIGCLEVGTIVMNTNTDSLFILDDSKAHTSIGLGMTWSYLLDSQNNLWIGSINGGLFLYDSLYNFKKNYIPYASNTESINSLSISSMVEDNHGNIWFGTHGGGLNILYKRKNIFKHFKKTTNINSISHNYVSSFYELNKNEIWIGTDGGGINIFNKESETFKYLTTKDGLSSNAILSLKPYNKDKIITSSWEGGAMIFDTKTHKIKFLQHEENNPNSLNYKYIKDAIRFGDTIYIATHSKGVNIYDIKNDKFYNSTNDTSLIYLSIPQTANNLLYKRDNLWVTSTVGLFRISDNKVYKYVPDSKNKNSILDIYITDIFLDSKNRLWVGTLKGLNLYDRNSDSFIRFDDIPELSTAIMSICEDDNHNLWFGSNSGLMKYNHDSGDIITYNETDGIQGNQFFERAAYKDSQGNLYFGGMNGFNTFHPTKIEKDTTTPVIYFSDFKIFYNSQKPSDSSSVLKKHINFTDEIILDYSKKIITIEFTAIHMLVSSKNEYKYKLEGFDNEWYNVGTNRYATYTNLAPGTYKFRVKASNADKIWNKKSRDILITVLSPWWMTWWFRTFAFIFIFFILVLIYYIRTRNIKQQNKKLEEKVKARTKELELSRNELKRKKEELEESKEELIVNNVKLQETINTKDRFFSIIAHDLKNPMNAMLGFSDLLMKNWAEFEDFKKQKFIGIINTSTNNLFTLLTNLLDWSRSQTGDIKITFEKININSLISENIALLDGQANKKNIQLEHLSISNNNLEVWADNNMLNTVIRNIISNAIKYTPDKGKIEISAVSSENNSVNIIISDNGIGMTNEQINTLFKADKNHSTPGTNNEKGTGLGLIVCNEFIVKNNGKIFVNSKLGDGTTFIITVPSKPIE